jgi:limonene-1,2-epoxide hydrolase
MRSPPTAASLAVLGSLALTAGCGGGTPSPPSPPAATAPSPAAPRAPRAGIAPQLQAPRRVPRRATGVADAASVRVINRWLGALRRGQIVRAARLFALPSLFQNGTTVVTLAAPADAIAVTAGFPCGAVATHFAAAGAFTLVRVRLTPRVGGDCRGAEGGRTGGAIRVVDGRIHEWYRLYDAEEGGAEPRGPAPGDLQV